MPQRCRLAVAVLFYSAMDKHEKLKRAMGRDFLLRPQTTVPDLSPAIASKTLREAADAATQHAGRVIGQKTRQWCAAHGVVPATRIEQAAEVLMMITAVQKKHLTEADLQKKIESFVAGDPNAEQSFKAALEQVKQCMQELGPEVVAASMREE